MNKLSIRTKELKYAHRTDNILSKKIEQNSNNRKTIFHSFQVA